MPVFADTNELYAVMTELWAQIKADPVMSHELLKSQLIVRFHYKEPEGYITVDGSDGKEIKITLGDCDAKPIVELTMKSDVAHAFWSGKENPAVALLNGKMMSKGPVNKALALLPVVKPAFQLYPSIVAKLKKSA
ncbi:MAG TPA: SCP2 sterol-binding domain-containing protein [Oculatellaceae cyanobacterium]